MAWNKPSMIAETNPHRGRVESYSLMKRKGFLVSIVVIVAILGVVCVLFLFALGNATDERHDASRGRSQIKEATPAKAKQQAEVKSDLPKKQKSLTINGKTHPDFVPIGIQRIRKKVHEVRTNDTALAETDVPYRSATEQVLTAIFMTPPGNMPPPSTMLNLSQSERENIVMRLMDKTEITDKDSEELATSKEVLIEAKKEMLNYLKNGGEPKTFLSYYYNQLDKAYLEKKLVTTEILRVIKEDPKIARDFIEKANESLRQKGISEVQLPEAYIHIMEIKCK